MFPGFWLWFLFWFGFFAGQSRAGNGGKLRLSSRGFITQQSSLLLPSESKFDFFSSVNIIYRAMWSMITLSSQHWQMDGFILISFSRVFRYVHFTRLETPLPSPFSVFFSSASACDIYKSILTTEENAITPVKWTMRISDLQTFNLISTEKPKLQCLLHADYPSRDSKNQKKHHSSFNPKFPHCFCANHL